MTQRKQLFLKSAAVLSVIPALIYASASGPEARSTGAPGDNPNACAKSGCHVGTAVNGGPAGNKGVEIIFPTALVYTPGVKQRWRVEIKDTANRDAFGFQATARLAANPATQQAGTFTPGENQVVVCSNDNVRPAGGCPSSNPIEFISHNPPRSLPFFEFDWTPPSHNSGDVQVFVAVNAADGNGQNTGDRIYTASYTLTPDTTAIPQATVVNGASFQSGIASGAWVTIFGPELSLSTRDWSGAITPDGAFPTELDGVRVNINNKPAFINFISPGQVNVQAPEDASLGPVQIEVIRDNTLRARGSAQLQQVAPALFRAGSTDFPAATHPDGVAVGKPNLIPGGNFRPAKPGQAISLWGTGFGPTKEPIPPGRIVTRPSEHLNFPQVMIGSVMANVPFAGVTIAGVTQVNVVIPASLPSGDHPILLIVGGIQVQTGLSLTVDAAPPQGGGGTPSPPPPTDPGYDY